MDRVGMRRHAGDDSGAALADEYVVPFIGRDLATAVWTSLAHVLDQELHHPTLLPGAGRHRQQPLEQVETHGITSRVRGTDKLADYGLKVLRRAGSHGGCAGRYATTLEAVLAHARHWLSVQRQGWSERLRVHTTVVLRG